MKAVFEPAAHQELVESIRWYLTEAGPARAIAFAEEVERAIALLARRPQLGTHGKRATRSIPLRRYPYSIHYRAEPDLIRIIALAHHRRRPGYWARRR